LDPASWTVERLDRYIGGLSAPSKMPGYSYSIPAQDCVTGGRLRLVADSVCEHCYAYDHGRYGFANVKRAQRRRARRLRRPQWVAAFAELLNRRAASQPFFRWHDSGDLQGTWHLANIVRVAWLTPDVNHWIPTREYATVGQYIAEREAAGVPRALIFPPNLTVRLSVHMIGGHVPTFPRFKDLTAIVVSTVNRGDEYPDAHVCPSNTQGSSCGDCRACWTRDVRHVTYPYHY
jgi:hypothetical protein